jgi:putative oxidoreductase
MRSFEKLKPLALLMLRWGLGIIFVYHGYPKLFTQTQQALQGFPRMGFPAYFVYIAGVVEFFGGFLLLVGFATRIAGLLLAGEMAIAIWKVHLPQGGAMAVSNYQLPLALAVGAFALVATGAGLLSLDYGIFKDKA